MHLSLNNNFQDLHALFTEEHNSVLGHYCKSNRKDKYMEEGVTFNIIQCILSGQ